MKKHDHNSSSTSARTGARLSVRRETVRILTRQDLALIAAGASTTIITERPTQALSPC